MISFYSILSLFCWLIASFFSIKRREKKAIIWQTAGVLIFAVMITCMWVILQRPPFKTIGETKIWYSFFLSAIGFIIFLRWRTSYFLTLTNILAAVFVIITICNPARQSHVLAPALQSVWFIPHVAIYMFAYATIGCATILALLELMPGISHYRYLECAKDTKMKCDLLVKIGTSALGIGLCLGAIWAKKAWGQYWSWDIKETAALITWVIFLLYIHIQKFSKINRKVLLIILIIGFLALQFTWFGVKYLPSGNASPHNYLN